MPSVTRYHVDYQEMLDSLSAIWDNTHRQGPIVDTRHLVE
jgi:hypothetical protein